MRRKNKNLSYPVEGHLLNVNWNLTEREIKVYQDIEILEFLCYCSYCITDITQVSQKFPEKPNGVGGPH